MFDVTDLPAVNASLNAIATCWLVTGYMMIRRSASRSTEPVWWRRV